MRAMKSRLSGTGEKEQQLPGVYSEGLDMREGSGPAHRQWNETQAAGPEAITFEKGQSSQLPTQSDLAYQKQQAFQQAPAQQQYSGGYQQSRLQPEFQSSQQQGFTEQQPDLRGWSQSSEPIHSSSHIDQQGLGEWEFPEQKDKSKMQTMQQPLYYGGQQTQQLHQQPLYHGQPQRVTVQSAHPQPYEHTVSELEQRVTPRVVMEERVRMTRQEVDVPVVQSTQRILIAPIHEAVVTHRQEEEEFPVVQHVPKSISVPKVMMRPKEIDVPVIGKVKKIVEIELEQDVINWEKRTIEEPFIVYENKEIIEDVVSTEKRLVDVPIVEEVTKELQIPINEQHIVFQRQEIDVPIVEKAQFSQPQQQPVMQETVQVVSQVPSFAGEQRPLREPEKMSAQPSRRTEMQEGFGNQLSLEEVLQRKSQRQGELMTQKPLSTTGQYNLQHDAGLAYQQPLE